MENDLISRKALLKTYTHWLPQLERPEDAGDRNGVKTCIAVLQDAPAVDAVKVVRCFECVKRGNSIECPMCHDVAFEDDSGDIEWYTFDNTDDDGFCYRGERKKENAIN